MYLTVLGQENMFYLHIQTAILHSFLNFILTLVVVFSSKTSELQPLNGVEKHRFMLWLGCFCVLHTLCAE